SASVPPSRAAGPDRRAMRPRTRSIAARGGTGCNAALPARVHFAAPPTRFAAARLDKLLERLDRALQPRVQHADRIADVLHGAFGFVSHHEAHARRVGAQRFEADGAGVDRTRSA